MSKERPPINLLLWLNKSQFIKIALIFLLPFCHFFDFFLHVSLSLSRPRCALMLLLLRAAEE